MPHGHGKEIFSQPARTLIDWSVKEANGRHQENLWLAKHIGAGRKDALQKKGLLEGFAVLLGFVFGDSEIFGKRAVVDAIDLGFSDEGEKLFQNREFIDTELARSGYISQNAWSPGGGRRRYLLPKDRLMRFFRAFPHGEVK